MTRTIQAQNDLAAGIQPADLRESLGADLLLKLALDAVQALEPSKLDAAVSGDSRTRPQMMLTLLPYCYAGRIYGSREIEWATRNDKTAHYICAREFPDSRAIRHFRRYNRELVEQCLSYVLRKGWVLQFDALEGLWATCTWLGAGLEQRVAMAAREKIEVAIIMDTAESD